MVIRECRIVNAGPRRGDLHRPRQVRAVQADGTNAWCSQPTDGVSYNDLTPRWGVAWDVFGNGKTSVKWNMGKYLPPAGFGGVYTDNNPARRSTNFLTRGWDDVNGNRIVECDFVNPAPYTGPTGDVCGSMLQTTDPQAGRPTTAFLQFGRPPNASQLANTNSFCGRTENSSTLHQQYCQAAGQNLMAGWDTRRNEWQFGLGIQHELLPRLSGEVTSNTTYQSRPVPTYECWIVFGGQVRVSSDDTRRLEGRESLLLSQVFGRPSRRRAPPEAGHNNAASSEAEPHPPCGSWRSEAELR